MRFLIALALILAIPAFASAQQADAAEATTVQLEQSITADETPYAPVQAETSTDAEQATDAADGPTEATVVQEPASRSWWYIVGAVVVGGLILALLL